MRIHHISSRKRSSLLVALLCLIMSAAEASGQCAVTPIPVGVDSMSAFETSVDLDGDIAVIGDMSDEPFGFRSGSVKVRRFNGSVWVEEAILTASNGALGDWFGTRVAISGEVIAVAAFAFNNPVNAVGAAYIYRYNPTTMVWEEEAILTRQTAAPASNSGFFGANLALDHSGFFGANLALDGDVVAIAGLTVNGAGENIMGAHIFRYNPVTFAWEFEQVVTIDDEPVSAPWFPNNWMALDGNVLIAGEPSVSSTKFKGAAWIYRYDGATWNLDVKISSPTTISGHDFFGIGVDVLGDMAIIGVPIDSEAPSGLGAVGAVYVYEYDGASWNFTQKVVPVNTAPLEYGDFGVSLSLAADAMLVGAFQEDEPLTLANRAGSVYHFKREGTSWVEQGRMFAPDAMSGDEFSMSLAISGDRAIISSGRLGDVTGLGRAYIVDGFRGIGGPDCNNNTIADYCDIFDAASLDCNANGIPDSCESIAPFSDSSPVFSPFGSGASAIHTIVSAPSALSDVTMSFEAVGMLTFTFHNVDVLLNGTFIDTVFKFGASNCPLVPDTDSFVVDMDTFNTLVGGGDAVLVMQSSNFLPEDCDGATSIAVTIDYLANTDVNANGVPDECDLARGDFNLDGEVNVTDLLSLLAAWGVCTSCVEDINEDGSVNVTDLLSLLAAWGT